MTAAKSEWVNDAMGYVDDIVRNVENDYRGSLADAKKDLRAALERQAARCAQLEEALSDYLDAQDALDNHELAGINAEDYFVLMRRRNSTRDVLDAARSALSAPKEQST